MSGRDLSRRLFLQVSTLSAMGVVLSGCGPSETIDLALEDGATFGYFEPDQVAILEDVADLMIPATETVGAADTQTVLYLDQLMQTWAGEATKQEIQAFMDGLEAQAQTVHQAAYLDLPDDLRLEFLREIDQASFASDSDLAFAGPYQRIKRLIFHIHYTSDAANPDFVLIPGQYRGDVSEAEYAALVEDNRY